MIYRLYASLATLRSALVWTLLAAMLSISLIQIMRALPPSAPSVVALQLAFTPSRMEAVLNAWGASGRQAYLLSLAPDFFYPLAYACALGAWIAFLTAIPGRAPSFWVLFLFTLPFVAAAMDYVENFLHLWMLALTDSLSPSLIFLASLAAAIKWGLAGISLLSLPPLFLRRWMIGRVSARKQQNAGV